MVEIVHRILCIFSCLLSKQWAIISCDLQNTNDMGLNHDGVNHMVEIGFIFNIFIESYNECISKPILWNINCVILHIWASVMDTVVSIWLYFVKTTENSLSYHIIHHHLKQMAHCLLIAYLRKVHDGHAYRIKAIQQGQLELLVFGSC